MIVSALTGGPCLGGSVFYVDAAATLPADGLTWCSAWRTVSDALDLAPDASVVRISGGIYTPDTTGLTNPRHATFQLRSGLTLMGGFAGCQGADPKERDILAYETVLSGDLAGDDGPDFSGSSENCYHVVTASGVDDSCLLDGISIAGGRADGLACYEEGVATGFACDAEGECASGSCFEPLECFGGALAGEPCTVSDDCPGGECRGAMHSMGAGIISFTGQPTMIDCTMRDNFASFQGAGVQNKEGSHASYTRCTFSGNTALDNGGAMYNGQSSPYFTDCLFTGNTGGHYAGAICNRDHSNGIFVNCTFTDNTAALETLTGGGAIANASSSPTFSDCLFIGNHAIAGNGASMYNKLGFAPEEFGTSDPLIDNCEFLDNDAGNFAGGIYNTEGSRPTIIGCLFAGNESLEGSGIYNTVKSQPLIEDCVFENNTADKGGGLYCFEGVSPTIRNCLFDSNYGREGGGMWSDGSPLVTGCTFVNNTSALGGGFYNQEGSPVVEDCDFVGNRADIFKAGGGGGIWNLIGAPVIERCSFIDNVTTGIGQNVGGAVQNYFSESIITDCYFEGNQAGFGGGAIYVESGDHYLARNVYIGNFVNSGDDFGGGGGGAIYSFQSSPVITSSLFADNFVTGTIGGWGGAILSDGGNADISFCTIYGNSAQTAGGGMTNFNSTANVSHCIVRGNTPDQIDDDLFTFADVRFSNVEGGWSRGAGVMDEDPLFVDAAGLDFHLQSDSPCINAGDPTLILDTGDEDIDAQSRIVYSVADMGADEFVQFGDSEPDGDVDLVDFAMLQLCFTGPGSDAAPECAPFDLDQDGDVDLVDFGGYQLLFTGSL
jgi:predicted outer membrane repeat protein